MRWAVLVLLAAGASCNQCDEVLSPYCPQGRACWLDTTSPIPNKATVGQCQPGTVVCLSDGSPTCAGTITASGEVCDGLDNDCDGETDEFSVLLEIPDCREVFCGHCRPATAQCVNGEPTCVSVYPPEVEVCNGVDDDCDCVVDNDIAVEFFYDGPPGTVGRGECVPGIRYCEAGGSVEVPPVYPREESCDGRDNDCDGFVDETGVGPTAYYLILDVSGSMLQYKDVAAQAFCDFARALPTNTSFAVALVAASDLPPFVVLMQDFADAETTCATVSMTGFTLPFSGLEYALEPWPLPTYPGSDTALITVTDEPLAVFGENGLDPAGAVGLCATQDLTVWVYTHQSMFDPWQPIVDVCGGGVYPLPVTTGAFRDAFLSAFLSQCGATP